MCLRSKQRDCARLMMQRWFARSDIEPARKRALLASGLVRCMWKLRERVWQSSHVEAKGAICFAAQLQTRMPQCIRPTKPVRAAAFCLAPCLQGWTADRDLQQCRATVYEGPCPSSASIAGFSAEDKQDLEVTCDARGSKEFSVG